MDSLRKFVAPEYIFGAGSRALAGRYARNLGGRRALVVTDPGVVAAGWSAQVVESLSEAGLSHVLFRSVSSNPRAQQVMEGAELYREQGCNILVAVGGGSSIDAAKGIGIVSTHGRHILEFQGVDQVQVPMPPLICIPTTGGSAADVSQFAIINDPRERVKVAIVSKALVPDVSLVDPETLTTLDPHLTACTAMDALTHGIEAFVSNAHSPMTDLHALEAIGLISRNLLASMRAPGDIDLRARIMLGSLHAGLAFSNAILGAVHAMAHSLGGYLDLAHGECNAILLDRVVDFNFEAAPERFEKIAETMGLDLRGLTTTEKKAALVVGIRKLKEEAGLTGHLAPLGVGVDDIPLLSRKALRDPCLLTNPRPSRRRDLEVIYGEAL